MRFWAALWNTPDPSFEEDFTRLMWSDPCPICTALSFSCFFFPLLLKDWFKCASILNPSALLPPLTSYTGFVSGPGGGTVVSALWLPAPTSLVLVLIGRHLALATWLQSTRACIPFLFFPPWFPSAVHSTGSGFRALSLACSLPPLGSP